MTKVIKLSPLQFYHLARKLNTSKVSKHIYILYSKYSDHRLQDQLYLFRFRVDLERKEIEKIEEDVKTDKVPVVDGAKLIYYTAYKDEDRFVKKFNIGAGDGRFVLFFLYNYPNIKEYIVIEPSEKLIDRMLKRLVVKSPRLEIVQARYEDIRTRLVKRKFDIVILWDVLMYMDLDQFEVLEEAISMARKYLLFSLHPIQEKYMPRMRKSDLRKILQWLDKHPDLLPIGKLNMNRIYKIL